MTYITDSKDSGGIIGVRTGFLGLFEGSKTGTMHTETKRPGLKCGQVRRTC
jgi:hypothetical protein